ncbi:hypothetical protein L596_028022 [Steinernema carpocapsae]|uniref:Uncharacterized protein n=1 Tax=Steinernema carpocapsae TaxID=34508 RepID=A0A4V5ZXY4_STECR|nr:hypothetical protein L596_028022 [Steinernema carpocapsae]
MPRSPRGFPICCPLLRVLFAFYFSLHFFFAKQFAATCRFATFGLGHCPRQLIIGPRHPCRSHVHDSPARSPSSEINRVAGWKNGIRKRLRTPLNLGFVRVYDIPYPFSNKPSFFQSA